MAIDPSRDALPCVTPEFSTDVTTDLSDRNELCGANVEAELAVDVIGREAATGVEDFGEAMEIVEGVRSPTTEVNRRYRVWNPVGYGLASLFDQKRPAFDFVQTTPDAMGFMDTECEIKTLATHRAVCANTFGVGFSMLLLILSFKVRRWKKH